jgi:diguanylate cyclase (GGDEF)-like protein
MKPAARLTSGTTSGLIVIGLTVVLAATAFILGLADLPIWRSRPQNTTTMFWVLAAVAVLGDFRPFALPGHRRLTTVYLSVCFTFAIMLRWGSGPAMVVQIVAVLAASVRLRQPAIWTAFTVSRLVLALGVAEIVLDAVAPWFGAGFRLNRLDVLVVLTAACAWFVTNYSILIVGVRLRYGVAWGQVFNRTFGYEALSTGALLVLAPLLVGGPSPWVMLFLLVPLFAVSQMGKLSIEQHQQSRVDPLTGLMNRRALTVEVDELIARGGRRGSPPGDRRLALLLLDLDRFKHVNDALGHAVGDQLLAEVAHRLVTTAARTTARTEDLVARLGGDEFGILVPDVADAAQARSIALSFTDAFHEPAYMDGLPLDVSGSIGVALYPEHGKDFATLMRHADVAMYEAKRRGGAVAVYTVDSDRNSAERLSLLADLRRALVEPAHAEEIAVHYQPQVCISTGDVVGVEALLRWRHPTRGMVEAEEAIRVAEHSIVMHLLTRHVLDEVTAQLAQWNGAGLVLRASVNVSVRDLDTPEIVDYLAGRLVQTGVSASQLDLEITEGALMADPHRAQDTARGLARLGVGLSLDDFGTGYSSLQHLRRLPLTEVKIDRSFVQTMSTDPDDEAIVRSIIELSGALGLRVVAEGVENEQTRQMLVEARCDLGQGWYYGRPMPAEQLVGFLANRKLAEREPPDREPPAGRCQPAPGPCVRKDEGRPEAPVPG